ncbi:hypothetical protein, conserved [Babesia ovata]|uniref:C3H1-type domain-containing protein n=1 Tax=Babesia ovata TaxID=189622 RepID=A0A2H6KAH3_9APIC|nr:uncharacterized protein BOVATA_014940 [Babesia ovata]GBE60001.1 hypothetical protein, conserved [Babesia ovata]
MSFLHGVLETVKDDESVTKYSDINDINNVIKKLNDSVGKGREAFRVAVTQVDEKIKKVTSPLSSLYSEIDTYNSSIDGTKNDSISLQHDKWQRNVTQYFTYAEQANNALANLDTNLKNKLETPIGKIHSVVKLVYESATDLELDAQVRKVDWELGAKKREIENKIAEKSEELQKELDTRIGEIHGKLRDIEDKRSDKLAPLLVLVSELEKDVTEANSAAEKLNNEYHGEIVNGLGVIYGEFQNLDTSDIADQLSSVFANVDEKLQELMNIHDTIHQQGNLEWRIIHSELAEKIRTLNEQVIEKLVDYIKDGLGEQIKNALTPMTDAIYKNPAGNGPLNRIVEGLNAYAIKVGQTFGNTANSWLDRLLGDNDAMVIFVEQYIQNTKGNGQLPEEELERKRNEVMQAIKPEIIALLRAPSILPPTGHEQQAQANIKYIQAYFDSVAGVIEGGNADDIAGRVDTGLKLTLPPMPGRDAKGYLTSAIQILLIQLSLIVRKIADEFKAFAGLDGSASNYKLGEKVDEAIRDVNKLGRQIKDAVANGGSPSDLGNKIITALEDKVNNGAALAIETFAHGAFKHGTKKFRDSLDLKINGADNNGIRNSIERQLDKLYKHVDPKSSGAIQKDINTLQANINKVKDLLTAIKGRAGKYVKDRVSSVTQQVAELRSSISAINEQVKAFNLALEQDVKTAKSAVEAAHSAMKDQISLTQSELSHVVSLAFTAVKNGVQAMWSKKNKAELGELKNLVGEQNKEINKIIDDDKKSGVKGFIKTLEDGDAKYDTDRKGKNIEKLTNVAGKLKPTEYVKTHFTELCMNFKQFWAPVAVYVNKDIIGVNRDNDKKPVGSHVQAYSRKMLVIYDRVNELLTHIKDANKYDSALPGLLDNVTESVSDMKPEGFSKISTPVIDSILGGLGKFVAEMKRAYVSTYDGQRFTDPLFDKKEDSATKPAAPKADQTDDKNELSAYGKKCARVCLTIVGILYRDFDELRDRCTIKGPCNKKRIYLYESAPKNVKRDENLLGHWFQRRGYGVSKEKNGHEGHLRNEDNFTGQNIHTLIEEQNIIRRPSSDEDALSHGIIVQLHDYISTYYQVCHITLHESPKYPCTIRDMLSWMSGLPYRTVYTQIPAHCKKQLNEEDKSTGKFPNREDAVLSKTLAYGLVDNLSHTCRKSLDVLVTICGNGRGFEQADYPYTCNFMDNSRGFHYPENVPGLFDMLTDVCRRLLRSLNHLRTRCLYAASMGNGWAECSYGRDVSGYQWNCNTNQCPNQTCPQKHNQSAKQTPNQKCNQHPKCGVKSPLQSHLMDQLPGCLPHKLASVGCSATCSTCPKMSSGQQCITPMGFWDLPNSASKMRSGKELSDMLAYFCKDADSPLCALLHCLQCVKPSPPTTLADMFALYCQLSRSWRPSGYFDDSSFTNLLSTKTITNSFPLKEWFHGDFTNADVTNALIQLYHSDNDHKSASAKGADTTAITHSDLASLTGRSKCINSLTCAPYLQPVCLNAYHTYPQKHAKLYLSWFTYLAWKFWKLLQELLDAFQQISCKNNGCANCACRAGKHGDEDACKCLEKFLGYKDGNYTGSGIVYSDLDRLCDGVMAFLHGVLSGVRDDENVKKYDNMLQEPTKKLNDVLSTLQSKIGSGRVGLSASVAKVKEWLGKYNEEVGNKTRGVTDGLSTLIGKLSGGNSSDAGENVYYKEVEKQAGNPLARQLAAWTKTLSSISSALDNEVQTEINKLDSALSAQIMHKIDPITKVIAHLEKVAGNEAFAEKVRQVDSEITTKKDSVTKEIRVKAEALRGTLKQNLDDINGRIDAIGTERTTTLKALKDSVQQLETAVTEANTAAIKLDEEHENEIVKKLEEINPKVQALGTEKIANDLSSVYSAISSQLEKLGRQVESLRTIAGAVHRDVDGGLENIKIDLRDNINKLTGQLMSNFEEYFKQYITKVRDKVGLIKEGMTIVDPSNGSVSSGSKNGSQLKQEANSVKDGIDGLNSGLNKGAAAMGSAIHQAVENVNGALNGLESIIIRDLGQAVKEKITQEINNLSGGSGSSYYGSSSYTVGNGVTGHGNTAEFGKGMSYGMSLGIKHAKSSALGAVSSAIDKIKSSFHTDLPNVNEQIYGTGSAPDSLKSKIDAITKNLTDFFNNGGVKKDNSEFNLTQGKKFDAYYQKKTAADGITGVVSKITQLEKVYPTVDTLAKNLVNALGIQDSNAPQLTDTVKVEDNLHARVDEKIKAADPQLDELLKKAVKKGITMLDQKVTDIHTELNGVSPAIEPQINKLQIKTGAGPDNIQTQISELQKQITELKTLLNGVNNKARSTIKTQVTSMREQVGKLKRSIEQINLEIKAFNSSLEESIKQANQAVTTARQQLGSGIDGLQRELTQQVNTAFKEVYDKVKEMFNQGHKEDLAQLKKLVSEQSEEIRKLIEAEKISGLKGLMAKMYETGGSKILELKLDGVQENKRFETLSERFKGYLSLIVDYITKQVTPPSSSPPNSTTKEPTKMLGEVQSKLVTLLENLGRSKHFDNVFVTHLQSFSNELDRFTPSQFAGPENALLLDSLRDGLQKLRDQLDRAYVSAYSGEQINNKNKDKCANAFVTCLPTINRDLWKLKYGCKNSWKFNKIYDSDSESLGAFLKGCDYTVSTDADKQDGELKNDNNNMLGANVAFLLTKDTKLFKKTSQNDSDVLQKLVDHIKSYNQVGHVKHIPSPRTPCSIYEMLTWCTGLQYNSVYDKLVAYCNDYDTKDDAYLSYRLSIAVTYQLPSLSTYSHDLLTTILGTGDEHTTYASDFANNSLEFNYPASPAACLDTLLDILRRLFPVFRYMLRQCKFSAQHAGWSDCEYGRDIALAKWPCKAHPTAKPNGQSTMKPNGQSTTEPTCQPTSPLMSYLNDCLPGQLPHQLISVGCTAKCITCSPGSRGMPCLTPLGFRGFSGSRKKGRDLCTVLDKFLSNEYVTCLFTLGPKPPSTLPEHFQFVLSLVKGINVSSIPNQIHSETLVGDFSTSMNDVSINLYSQTEEFTNALTKAYGSTSPNHGQCDHSHLRNLTMYDSCKEKKNPDIKCAPFLSTLCHHSYRYLAKKNCKLYLSWALYLPWTFWDLLNNLYDEFCNINCPDWGCRGCLRGDKCKKGKHGVIDKEKQDAICQCPSIVGCKGVSPTLYKYGFMFGHASKLNAGHLSKRCSDFCQQLSHLLKSKYFTDLFDECDMFLWKIREPFSQTLLALWSLSLLYLLHIAVVRLDVLRIRSHLRSPASHRIAAQSLLAAARVKALANVKYFSP